MPCWFYEKRELVNSPSIRAGLDEAVERKLRADGATFILRTGSMLGLAFENAATGVVYFHRFYMHLTFQNYPRYVTAACCLFLAGKVEETPKKCRDIIRICNENLTEEEFAEFGSDPKEEVMTLERILLHTIKFDLQIDHPYKYLFKLAKKIKSDNKVKLNSLVETSYTFITDSLCTTLSIQWEPDIIAIAMIYLASRMQTFPITDWVGKKKGDKAWWECMNPDIHQKMLEDICHQVLDMYQKKDSNLDLAKSNVSENKRKANASHTSPMKKKAYDKRTHGDPSSSKNRPSNHHHRPQTGSSSSSTTSNRPLPSKTSASSDQPDLATSATTSGAAGAVNQHSRTKHPRNSAERIITPVDANNANQPPPISALSRPPSPFKMQTLPTPAPTINNNAERRPVSPIKRPPSPPYSTSPVHRQVNASHDMTTAPPMPPTQLSAMPAGHPLPPIPTGGSLRAPSTPIAMAQPPPMPSLTPSHLMAPSNGPPPPLHQTPVSGPPPPLHQTPVSGNLLRQTPVSGPPPPFNGIPDLRIPPPSMMSTPPQTLIPNIRQPPPGFISNSNNDGMIPRDISNSNNISPTKQNYSGYRTNGPPMNQGPPPAQVYGVQGGGSGSVGGPNGHGFVSSPYMPGGAVGGAGQVNFEPQQSFTPQNMRLLPPQHPPMQQQSQLPPPNFNSNYNQY